MDTIDELTREYQRWLHNEGLPQVSAEELLRTDLTYSQHVWISIFIERWEFAQEFESQSFSDLLEAYLKQRDKGPDEDNGYADKAYHRRLAALRKAMDTLVAKKG